MKRRFLVFGVLFCSVLALTGCGSKKETKLVCTQTTSGVDIEIDAVFKNDEITTVDFSYGMDLSKYSDTQIEAIGKQDFCKIVKSAIGAYKDAFGNCKHEIKDKKLSLTASLDPDQLASTGLSKKSTPEQGKKSFESQGYKCEAK